MANHQKDFQAIYFFRKSENTNYVKKKKSLQGDEKKVYYTLNGKKWGDFGYVSNLFGPTYVLYTRLYNTSYTNELNGIASEPDELARVYLVNPSTEISSWFNQWRVPSFSLVDPHKSKKTGYSIQ